MEFIFDKVTVIYDNRVMKIKKDEREVSLVTSYYEGNDGLSETEYTIIIHEKNVFTCYKYIYPVYSEKQDISYKYREEFLDILKGYLRLDDSEFEQISKILSEYLGL